MKKIVRRVWPIFLASFFAQNVFTLLAVPFSSEQESDRSYEAWVELFLRGRRAADSHRT